MKTVSSVGVKSVFKIFLVLGACAGVLTGLLLMIKSIHDGQTGEGVLIFVLAPILYGLIGGVANAVMAWLYNKVAERLGGVEIHFED